MAKTLIFDASRKCNRRQSLVEKVEQWVTKSRGHLPPTASNDSYVGLQAKLASMESDENQAHQLNMLDADLKTLGVSSKINSLAKIDEMQTYQSHFSNQNATFNYTRGMALQKIWEIEHLRHCTSIDTLDESGDDLREAIKVARYFALRQTRSPYLAQGMLSNDPVMRKVNGLSALVAYEKGADFDLSTANGIKQALVYFDTPLSDHERVETVTDFVEAKQRARTYARKVLEQCGHGIKGKPNSVLPPSLQDMYLQPLSTRN